MPGSYWPPCQCCPCVQFKLRPGPCIVNQVMGVLVPEPGLSPIECCSGGSREECRWVTTGYEVIVEKERIAGLEWRYENACFPVVKPGVQLPDPVQRPRNRKATMPGDLQWEMLCEDIRISIIPDSYEVTDVRILLQGNIICIDVCTNEVTFEQWAPPREIDEIPHWAPIIQEHERKVFGFY